MNVYKGCAVSKNINVTSLYSAFEADFKDGYSSVGEAHDFWELVFVKSGSVGVLAGDRILELGEKRKDFILSGLEKRQVIITGCENINKGKIFKVSGGKVSV